MLGGLRGWMESDKVLGRLEFGEIGLLEDGDQKNPAGQPSSSYRQLAGIVRPQSATVYLDFPETSAATSHNLTTPKS